MICEIAIVAQLNTSPIKRSKTQTFQSDTFIYSENPHSANIENYTQTFVDNFPKSINTQFTLSDFFESMKDLDKIETEKYRELLNRKKTIVIKSII